MTWQVTFVIRQHSLGHNHTDTGKTKTAFPPHKNVGVKHMPLKCLVIDRLQFTALSVKSLLLQSTISWLQTVQLDLSSMNIGIGRGNATYLGELNSFPCVQLISKTS